MTLFLYAFNLNYVPSASVFYREMSKRSGDGEFLLIDINQQNISCIKELVRKSDVVAFDNSIIIAISTGEILSKNFYVPNRKSTSFYIDVWSLVSSSSKPVFLVSFSSDLHAKNFCLPRDLYLDMISNIAAICWPYYRFPFNPESDFEVINSAFLKENNLSVNEIVNNWKEVTGAIKINIDLPHCISLNEMNEKSAKKRWDIIIPGAEYQTRKIALNSVKKTKIKISPYVSYRRWLVNVPYRIYKSFLPGKYVTLFSQKSSYSIYRYLIRHSTCAFACGGDLKYFVRKFIEIPSFRTAMIAYPTYNFGDYGFLDGVNYLKTFPGETGEKAKYLMNNRIVLEKLSKNAWDMVAEKHTASVRLKQVMDCISAFKKGKLKGAGFYEGKFEIIP